MEIEPAPAMPTVPQQQADGRPSLARGTGATVAADLVNALAAMVGVPYLLDRLGVEAYGVIGVVAVVVSQMAWLQLGVGPATTRRVAEALGRHDAPGLWAFFRASVVLGLGSGVVTAVVLGLVGPWLLAHGVEHESLSVDGRSIVTAAALTAFAMSLSASGTAIILGQERFGLIAVLRVVQGAGRVVAAVAAAGAGLGLVGVVWAQAALDVATALIAINVGTPRLAGPRGWPSFKPEMRDLLTLGAPFAATGGIVAILADAEKIVIALARPIADFAFYSVPHNITLRLGGLAMAFAGNLVPRLAFLGAAEGVEGTLAMMRRAARVALGLVGGGLALIIAVVPELLGAWLGNEFAASSSRTARLLLLVVVINTSASAYNAFLRARARPTALMLVYLFQLPPYLALLYVLVREWGIEGAAAALFVRSLLDLVCHRYAVDRALGRRAGGTADICTALVPLLTLALVCDVAEDGWLLARLLGGLTTSVFIVLRLLSMAEWKSLLLLVSKPGWRR